MQRSASLVALLALLAACAAPLAAAAQAAASDACGPDCASTYVPNLFAACLFGVNPNATVLPTTDLEAWDAGRRTFNYRTVRSPAAIFYASSTEEVAAAVKSTADWGVPVSPAAGRQGFQGLAAPDGALVIDVSALTDTSLGADGKTFRVGAGNANIMTMSKLHGLNITGAAVPIGVCIFVGSAGFNLGGGYGLLGRYLGLGCDNVVGLEMVLPDGSVVSANETSHPDLLWASCGGGGGTVGVVTAFEYRINTLPNGGRLSALTINYAPGVNATVAAFSAFQEALPTLDKRFGFTHSLTAGKFQLTGLFLGEPEEAASLLKQAGMLDNLDAADTVTPDTSELAAQYPAGLTLKAYPSFYDMAATTVPSWVPPTLTPWGSADNFTATPANLAFIKQVMAGKPRVLGGPDYNVWHYSQSRLADALPEEAIQAVAQFAADADRNCTASNFTAVECALSISGHVLGGAYADRAPDATAYPHRSKLFILDAVVAVPSSLVDSLSADPANLPLLAKPAEIVNDFLRILKPYVPDDAAYANYIPNALAGYESAFWGANAPRLASIKATYDPLGVFSKPYGITPAFASGSNASTPAAAPSPAPAPASAPPPSSAERRGWCAAAAAIVVSLAAAVLA